MTVTTINGQSVLLLDDPPDWSSGFKADFDLAAVSESGITGREIRRPVATHMRVRMSFVILVTGAEAKRLVNTLAEYTNAPVAVPLWGCAERWSQVRAPRVTGGLNLALRYDHSLWSIYTDTQPAWLSEADTIAPLLVGRLERPTLRWITPSACAIAINFVESSRASYAVRIAPAVFADGPAPSAAYSEAPLLFPATGSFDEPTSSWTVSIQRDQIGFTREPEETVYSQPALEQEDDQILMGNAEIGRILAFFAAHASGRPFWAAQNHCVAELTGPIIDGSTAAAVETSEGISVGDWISFQMGEVIRYAKASGTTPTGILFETAPGAVEIDAIVSRLTLVRFKRARLSVTWESGDVATFNLAVAEVPEEYEPSIEEQLGITLGSSWHRCYLYELTMGPTVERLTSHEEDVDIGGTVYTSARITHDEIARGIALDRDVATIRAGLSASSILRSACAMGATAPVKARILEASVTQIHQFGSEFGEEYQ